MNRLKALWRETKAEETEANIWAGRDERYFAAEGQAYRTASQVLPFAMLTPMIAGLIFLPETISKTAILQLAFLSFFLVMMVYWTTAKVVMTRKGVPWRDPVIRRRNLVLQFVIFVAVWIGIRLVLDPITGARFDWLVTISGALFAGLVYLGLTILRDRDTDRAARDDS